MPNGSGWHKGDRMLHRPTGQRGIVEGWKDGRLYIYWGTNNQQRAESWVLDEDCIWEPSPVEVLSAKGEHIATKSILTPTPLALPEIVLP